LLPGMNASFPEMPKKKILFIINTVSGVRGKSTIEEKIDAHLDHSIFKYRIAYSEYHGHASLLSQEAVSNHTDIIVAVGGDGSINEIARATVNTNAVIGIIPSGSGNGLAHHLKLPFRISRAIEVINQYKVKTIDTLRINEQLCVSIAGVGFDALVAKEFEKVKKRGFQAYFKIVLKEYINYRPIRYRIIIDGKEIRAKALFVSFANSNQFGYNAFIAPHAEVDDGWIDVCIIEKIPLVEVFFLGNLLFLKKIDITPYIQIHRGREIILSRKKGKIVNIDGELVKSKKTLSVQIFPSSLKIIAP
jgi:YegS/Rv2252/BmrU family lipid kinase